MVKINNNISEQLEYCIKFVVSTDNLIDFNEIKNQKDIGIVYFLYLISSENKPELVYIGKSKGYIFKSRINNHFIYKNERTGAKLENIKNEICSGNQVKIKYLVTEPESFRNMLEEELINHFNPIWNIQKKVNPTP